MRTIDLTESALADIEEGYRFYEKQLPGLGSHFEATMMSEIRALQIDAGVHRVYFGIYFMVSATIAETPNGSGSG